MSEPQNFLKALKDGQELLVPLLLLDGNYISYTSAPASPDSEGIEGLFKTATDGLYYFADGLWRKVPAYSSHWDDIDESVRFLPINTDIELTTAERQRLRKAISIATATLNTAGLVKGSTTSATYGAILISAGGQAQVPMATDASAGVVRVTDIGQDTTFAPVVATKTYVDEAITSFGKALLEPPTSTTLGGIMLGEDINECDSVGRLRVNKATYDVNSKFGLTHIAPPAFTLNVSDLTYDDANTDIPYVVTVSQAKLIARDIASKPIIVKTENIASTSQLGFVQISAQDGLSISETGVLSVNTASTTKRGIVMLYDDTIADENLLQTVPYMSQVKAYIQDTGYITAQQIPTATILRIGGIKLLSNGAVTLDNNGAITIRTASTTKPGIVQLTSTIPASENGTVLTAYQTKLAIDNKLIIIPDASPSIPGKVLVQFGELDVPGIVSTVPTVNCMLDSMSAMLQSNDFAAAVKAIIDANPEIVKKTLWKAYLFGPYVNEAEYNTITGALTDGSTFTATKDTTKTMLQVGDITAVFYNITVSKACTKDALYAKLMDAALAIREGNPITVTIIL